MNKILVSDIMDLNNDEYILNSKNGNVRINISGEVKLYLVNEKVSQLDINMLDNSVLYLYRFNDKNNYNTIVNINQNNNSRVFYNEAFINNENRELVINNSINGNNNESNINIRNISLNEESKIIINVNILKNTINNIALEDLKGINNGGMVHIEPNIVCESHEVVANHLTTIGSINKDELDYLMSKGINENNAKELILNGFIYSNMDDKIKNFGGE